MDRGIPYNLGILLYGEPGCGKTRFIKQLMNHTKRHGIDIKLSDNFDFNELKDIIYNEEIDYNYIIPQDQRIIIFEDIDAMGDVVKERKDKKKKKDSDINENTIESLESEDEGTTSNKKIMEKLLVQSTKSNNNNLSFLLNILDGLNECSGRIIIMTTNKIDHLDKALIRPGRIDIKIEFQKCSTYDIMMMICMFWKLNINMDMMRSDIDMKYTSAEVINIFRTTYNFEDIKSEFLV
jgi:chaperone BCS1